MKSYLSTALVALALAIPATAIVGCAQKTESEKTLERADKLQDLGMMMKDGETKEAEGKAMVAKGETVRDQGNRIDGEKMIAQGEALRDEGKQLQEKAKQMRN